MSTHLPNLLQTVKGGQCSWSTGYPINHLIVTGSPSKWQTHQPTLVVQSNRENSHKMTKSFVIFEMKTVITYNKPRLLKIILYPVNTGSWVVRKIRSCEGGANVRPAYYDRDENAYPRNHVCYLREFLLRNVQRYADDDTL